MPFPIPNSRYFECPKLFDLSCGVGNSNEICPVGEFQNRVLNLYSTQIKNDQLWHTRQRYSSKPVTENETKTDHIILRIQIQIQHIIIYNLGCYFEFIPFFFQLPSPFGMINSPQSRIKKTYAPLRVLVAVIPHVPEEGIKISLW